MIYPKFIKKGDVIGVPAPSDGAYCEEYVKRFKNAKLNLEKRGYKVQLSKNIFHSEKARSSDAISRAEEMNGMFENNANAIICAAGGEFLVEILPYIDFNKLVQNPKWVEGFSDPTGILFPITTKYDIATIYGNNMKTLGAEKYHKSLEENLEILAGNLITQNSYELYENERAETVTGLEGYNLTEKVYWKTIDNKEVIMHGRIIGGCIDIITELAGTKYDGTKEFNEKYKEDGIIWYFDNCELSKETLMRTLWKFNELKYFKYAKGIIFGRNGQEVSYNYGTMEEALKDSVLSKLNVPIIYDADISHKGPSMTIINGAIATIHCNDGKGNISFELK